MDEDAGTDAGMDEDAGTDAGMDEDAGTDAGMEEDAGMSSGTPCVFNSECPANERCECVDFDCTCQIGVRGTGQSGVDPCVEGNDCASSLCVEGNGGDFCSGECTTNADCGPNLPICLNVAFVGQICVREPNP